MKTRSFLLRFNKFQQIQLFVATIIKQFLPRIVKQFLPTICEKSRNNPWESWNRVQCPGLFPPRLRRWRWPSAQIRFKWLLHFHTRAERRRTETMYPPEQTARISRIVLRISRRFAKQNGHWFATPSSILYSQTAGVFPSDGGRSRSTDSFLPPTARNEWHSLMRGNNNGDAMRCDVVRFHDGGP